MVKEKSVVVYKNEAAVVVSVSDTKYTVQFRTAAASGAKPAVYGTQNVRAKDVLLLSEGPASSLEAVLKFADEQCPSADESASENQENEIALQIKECYSLLSAEDEGASYPFEELCSLFRGEARPDEAWGLFLALKRSVCFSQDLKEMQEGKAAFSVRSAAEVSALIKKAGEKEQEAARRREFIQRLKTGSILSGDSVFMGDVEALALGKTERSRAMHEAGIKETPERAHRLLLDTGIWSITRNPYPLRWGLSTKSAEECLPSPPQEERLRVPGISYAIDNEWSADPDDAVAFDGTYLWIHIADPASAVAPDSPIDKSARSRGATLYIPEGASRMLCEKSLEDYALGLKEESRALSFRILLDEKGGIEDCAVFKTAVQVKRLTYGQADSLRDSPELTVLFDIARRNAARREQSGAVQISLPEVHVTVSPESKAVSIEPAVRWESSEMVREMMLLAGEGAAKFAFKNQIPFPFVSQEAPVIPDDIPGGLAGQFRLRRCMRKRSVGVTPGMHCGLGLNMYSQVTSPLRRYSDLIAHMQLRAFLDGRKLLDKDTVLERVAEGDAGAQAAHKAERKSAMHWTLVYLLQNPDWSGEAVCVDRSQKLPLFSIPSLALETYMDCPAQIGLNGCVRVKVKKIEITALLAEFEIIE